MLDGWDVRGEIICPPCGVCIRGSLYYGSSFLAAAGGFSFLSLAIWAFLFLPWIRIGSVLFSFCADGYQETWIQWNGLSFRSVLLFFFFHGQLDSARHGIVSSSNRRPMLRVRLFFLSL